MFGRQVRVTQRQRDAHRGPGTQSALHRDSATVQTDQFVHQREADAGALHGARCLPLDAMKAIEDARQFILRDSHAGIADERVRQSCSSASCTVTPILPSSVYLNALETRFRTTRSHMSASTYTGSGKRRAVDIEHQSRMLAGGTKVAGKLGGVSAKVGRPERRLHTPRLDAGEVEQRVDQSQQSQAVAMHHVQPVADAPSRARRSRLPVDPASASAACGTRG